MASTDVSRKVDVESLHQTHEHINEWLKAHQAGG